MDYGYSGLFKSQNKGNTNGVDLFNKTNTLKDKVTPNRVKSIILDQSHEKFEDLGGWNALGTIETFDGRFIRPLNPNSKIFPLINEIVYIVEGLNITGENLQYSIPSSYYITNVGIWNHPHHNAYPNGDLQNDTDTNNYGIAFDGTINDTVDDNIPITDNSTGINLGKTFQERSNIHPLLPFEGDFIQEGRWGNSLRFGSTVKNKKNNWSDYGSNGDPITILRNGQGNQTEEGWIPIVEDINNNESSIYLTSTQQVLINSTDIGYDSYIAPKDESFTPYAPASPNSFSGKQIILNSGRLVFNSTNDHILLSSPLSINLNAQKSINIDTKNFIVSSENIFLGGINKATEPLLKGNLTVDFLQKLMIELKILALALSNAKTVPIILSPNSKAEKIPLDTSVTFTVDDVLTNLKDLEETYLSTPSIMTSEQNFTS